MASPALRPPRVLWGAIAITIAIPACFVFRGQGAPNAAPLAWEDRMPLYHPVSCAEAQCGPDAGCVDGPRGGACACAPGWGRTVHFRCVRLERRPDAGCTDPSDCSEGEVCERFTGVCRPRTAADCVVGRDANAGKRTVGDFCHVRGSVRVRGCGTLGEDDFCGDGLVCAPTGPAGYSGALCGFPDRLGGVCRAPCDPCAPSCPDGAGCFVVDGVAGGVCLPRGAVGASERECGAALCAPKETCSLGGAIGGVAHGTCERICAPDGGACGGRDRCAPLTLEGTAGLGACLDDAAPGF